jgi:hypothetical protein
VNAIKLCDSCIAGTIYQLVGEGTMAEELGKIEKPPVDKFKKGRKLYFIPLLYLGEDTPVEYLALFNKYWEQVTKQLAELESKLGTVNRMYHELIPVSGEEGCNAVKELNEKSHNLIQTTVIKGAQMEALEDGNLMTEFMDWGRCLLIGLQNSNVMNRIYDSYIESGKKRNEYIAGKIDETLDNDEIGILFMRENHQVQFPPDIQVFYVAPPALDEIKRWIREQEQQQMKSVEKEQEEK